MLRLFCLTVLLIIRFVTLADLSVVGQTYSIQAYTSLNDANRQNDTLRADVTHLVDLDNNLLSVEGLTVQSVAVRQKTSGLLSEMMEQQPLHQWINYILNGNPVVTNIIRLHHWLRDKLIHSQLQLIVLTMVQIRLPFLWVILMDNGSLHSLNDTIHASITGINPGITVTLELKTDDYPEETSWDLMDASGTVIQSGGNFTNAQSIYTQDFVWKIHCYTFVIYDTYGDGFNFGTPGYFKLIRSDGVILSTNTLTDFGYSESHLFLPTSVHSFRNFQCGGCKAPQV